MDSTLVLDGDTNTENPRLTNGDPTTSQRSASPKEIKWDVGMVD